MKNLNKAFKQIVNKHPAYAAQSQLPLNNIYRALRIKSELLAAFGLDYSDRYSEKFAVVQKDHPELTDTLCNVKLNEIEKAALSNHLWDELGDEIELLFREYLDILRDIEDQRSREYREDAIAESFAANDEFAEEAYLDSRNRAISAQAAINASVY
jgi:hypothetical protein